MSGDVAQAMGVVPADAAMVEEAAALIQRKKIGDSLSHRMTCVQGSRLKVQGKGLSGALLKQSLLECVRIGNQIPSPEQSYQDEVRRTGIAKKNLIESTELGGQIIQALDNGALFLALIGQKSLVESCINTKYAFAHPKKQNKIEWAYQRMQRLL